jgi:hypothetical protein
MKHSEKVSLSIDDVFLATDFLISRDFEMLGPNRRASVLGEVSISAIELRLRVQVLRGFLERNNN